MNNTNEGYPKPKFYKGQEVFFYDHRNKRIANGIIKDVSGYTSRKVCGGMFNDMFIEQWEYHVYTPLNNAKEMSYTLLGERELFETFKQCMNIQLDIFETELETASAEFVYLTTDLWKKFKEENKLCQTT